MEIEDRADASVGSTQEQNDAATAVNHQGLIIRDRIDAWCADALTAITQRCDVLEQAKKRFALEGIGLPLPQVALIVKDARHFDSQTLDSARL